MSNYDLTKHEGRTNMTVEEATAFLATAEFRLVECEWKWKDTIEKYNAPEVKHEDVWKALCRTDDYDDVSTGSVQTLTLERWVKHYRKGVRLGARYDDKTFCVVDALSDG